MAAKKVCMWFTSLFILLLIDVCQRYRWRGKTCPFKILMTWRWSITCTPCFRTYLLIRASDFNHAQLFTVCPLLLLFSMNIILLFSCMQDGWQLQYYPSWREFSGPHFLWHCREPPHVCQPFPVCQLHVWYPGPELLPGVGGSGGQQGM